MSFARPISKQQRNVLRLRERGGRTASVQLSRTGAEALDHLCHRHELTRRDAIEAAILDAALRADAFDARPLRLARAYGCSVDELRHLDGEVRS